MTTDALEAALLSLPLIEDCAVLALESPGGAVRVAYVVLRGPVTRQKIESHVTEVAPGAPRPDHVVFVNRLPYTEDGALDHVALSRVAVIDDALARRLESMLDEDPRFKGSAVVLEEPANVTPLLHERQLLPPTFAPPLAALSAAPEARAVARRSGAPLADSGPLAECEGPPLSSREGAPRTLPDALRAAALRLVDPRIAYLGVNQSIRLDTFSSLLGEARRIHGGLKARGVARGDKLVLQLERPEDVLPAFWGCLLGGIVPVLTAVPASYDAGTNDVERLAQVIRLLDRPRILTARSTADIGPLLERAGANADCVMGLEEVRSAHAVADERAISPETPAFFTLTSGSTGTPKAVMLSHASVLARARGTNRLCGHLESDRILNWLPFDHIGSISDWHVRCVVLGCHMTYCTKEYVLGDPLNWLRLIDRFRITHSWAPNFAYALVHEAVKRAGEERWDLSCLQTLLTAGEAVSSTTVKDFLEALGRHGMAPTVVRPAFGMAELGSGVTYYVPTQEHPVRVLHVDRGRLDGKLARVDAADPRAVSFTSLGPVIASARMRIVDEEGRVLPEDSVGRLQIGGDPVCLGYFDNPEANREVFAGGGWFNTGDRGFISKGELYLTGRDKESLVINGANFSSGEIEAVVSAVSGVRVSFTAACAVRDPGEGEKLAVFFSADVLETELRALLAEIQKQITSKIGVKADYLLPVAESAIPKTAIGKIQRKELVKRFERGDFEALVRRMDVLQQNDRTLPDWFLEPHFRPRARAQGARSTPKGAILVEDDAGLSEAVTAVLRRAGVPVTAIARGAALPRPAHPVSHVLDFADYRPQGAAATPGAERDSAEALVERLVEVTRTARDAAALGPEIRYLVVGSHSQVASAEDAVDVDRSAVPVALMTLTQELRTTSCAHLDVPFAPTARDLEAVALLVLSECTSPAKDPEIAYRQRGRLVRAFRRVPWSESSPPSARLERDGLYLITGGLGGVGAELSRYLLERWGANLVIVGRTPAEGPSADPGRRAVLADLERRGKVVYEAADVTDARALKDAVTRAELRTGRRVRGAFHLASAYHEGPLGDETSASLRAAVLPKVLGAVAVHAAVPDDAFVVCFTSLAGVNGGAGIGAYAAANRVVDSVCHAERRRGRLSYSASWSVWKGLGIGAESAPLPVLRSRGYHAIQPSKGFASLVAVLGLGPAHYAVGADPAHPSVSFRVEAPVEPLSALSAAVAPRGEAPRAGELPIVTDALGNPVPLRFRVLRGVTGSVTRDVLLAALQSGPGGARILATTPAQQKLAAIWQDVLGLDEVGINEAFFDIGGTSLLSLRLFAEVERVFGVALPLATLYRAPTIDALAAVLQTEPSRGAPDSIRLLTPSPAQGEAPLTLHLLHDSEGKTDVYRPLAAHLRGDVRLYAIAPHSEGPFPVLFTRIEDMAAHAAAQIRKVQPRGPYAVGGLGIGGALAHAVACRLQAAGEHVATVVLFDAIDSASKPSRSPGESGVFRRAERFLSSTSRLSTSLTRSGMDYARLKLLRRSLDRGERPPWYLEHIPFETVYRFALQDFAPQRFSGRTVLYRATLLAEPSVAQLAAQLKEELRVALTGDGAAKRSD